VGLAWRVAAPWPSTGVKRGGWTLGEAGTARHGEVLAEHVRERVALSKEQRGLQL